MLYLQKGDRETPCRPVCSALFAFHVLIPFLPDGTEFVIDGLDDSDDDHTEDVKNSPVDNKKENDVHDDRNQLV
jgi:hypothetical protein